LRLILSGPGSSGARPLPDGRKQVPGGWNRIIIYVDDLAARIEALRKADVRFRNYSDLALLPKSGSTADGTYSVAIVSHQSSALWLGTLTTAPWALTGPGSVHAFPRSATGEVQYCTVEGVTFLGPSRFAFVSDKSDGTAPCNRKDESIHIFELTGSLP